MPAFLGKYRGTVAGTNDPNRQGRLQVIVPDVLGGDRLSWAMPCVPYAGPGVGMIAFPPVGAHVWVEFEAGDPEFPIWTGCFWGPGELPAAAREGTSVLRVGEVVLVAADARPGGVAVPPASPGQAVTELNLASTGTRLAGTGRPVLAVDDQQVQFTIGELAVTLTARDRAISVAQGASTITVTADQVEIKVASSAVRVSATEVAVTSGAGKSSVTPGQVELGISGGAQVLLAGPSVNVNHGALEVT